MGSSYGAPEFDQCIVPNICKPFLFKTPWRQSNRRMVLKLKKNIFGGYNDYIVFDFATNRNGNALVRIQSYKASKKGNDDLMIIRHMNGKVMAILRHKKQLSGISKYILQNDRNQTVGVISKDSTLIAHNIFIKSPDEKKTYFYIHGSLKPFRFAISDKKNGLVAKAVCSDKVSDVEIEICKGMDFVMMICLIAAIGEYEVQQSSNIACNQIWKIISGSL